MYSYSLSSSSTSSSSSSSVSERPQRPVHVNPAFLHLQRLLEHLSFVHLHFTRWMIASGVGEVWSSLGSKLSCLLPISTQSPPVTAKLDWVLCPCSILVADSGHGELLDATQPVCGGGGGVIGIWPVSS